MTKFHLGFNVYIKQLIQEKNNTHKSYILSDETPQIFDRVKSLPNQFKYLTESNKEKYYLRIPKKLVDPITRAKAYWSILKTLLNNKKFPISPYSFIKVNIQQILKREQNYLTPFLPNNVSQYSTLVMLTLSKKNRKSPF